jgi:putative transposase
LCPCYHGVEELDYPFHDWTVIVTRCGRICYQRRKINLSQVFAGQKVGVKQTADHIWLVSFMEYDLGYFDDETVDSSRLTIPSARDCTHVSGMKCYLCARNGPNEFGSSGWIRTSNPPVNSEARRIVDVAEARNLVTRRR